VEATGLRDEIGNWQRAGIHIIVSLLTPEEERDLDLSLEACEAGKQGVEFCSLPILDRGVPESAEVVGEILKKTKTDLLDGKNVVVHCRQGIGRSALVAAALLMREGMGAETALQTIGTARGVRVPETDEQGIWIEEYAAKWQSYDPRRTALG
jgi:protein-tyrosine phosphatase